MSEKNEGCVGGLGKGKDSLRLGDKD